MLLKRVELCSCLLLAAVLVYHFCGSLLTGERIVGFRDSVYLYYPLMQWLSRFSPFDFPLWNPYCNLGMPVVGDGTSCVWYPGRLIFYLPGLSFDSRYGLFLTTHLVLAGCGSFWLARTLLANHAGAMLAAISYSLGGCVLTQMSNLIYLISAAWLPLALGSIWLMYREQDYRWSLIAGGAGALIILGGDPQLVYHLGIVATATGCWCWLSRALTSDCMPIETRPIEKCVETEKTRFRSISIAKLVCSHGRPLTLLLLFVATTSLLALAQIYASWDWSRHSQRVLASETFTSEQAVGDAQTFHAYQFSLPPWSLAELCWSNASGRSFPIHHRWTDGFPGADRIWYPSIYLGLATFWIAIGQFRFRGSAGQVWLTWIGLLFGLASFGWYGAVWLINECLPENYQINDWPQETGGLYWVLYQFLPLYSIFRYPAKLFLITSLCFCVLAGVGLKAENRIISFHWGFTFILISIALAISLATGSWNDFLNQVPPDGLFGPFDSKGCQQGLLRSLAASIAIISVLILIQTRLLKPRPQSQGHRWMVVAGLWSVVLLTSLDLTLANRWMLAEIHSNVMHSKIKLPFDDEMNEAGPMVSVYRSRDLFFGPASWIQNASRDRLTEVAFWQRQTLYPKQHLGQTVTPIRLLGSFSSIWPQQYEQLLDQLETEIYAPDRSGSIAQTSVIPPVGTKGSAIHGDGKWFRSEPSDKNSLTEETLQQLVNVVIHSDGRAIESAILDRAQKIVSLEMRVENREKDLDYESETSEATPIADDKSIPGKVAFLRSIKIESFTCDRIELHVNSSHPCRLVHHCFWDGNWRANFMDSVGMESLPLEPTGWGQGIDLPPGSTRLALVYQPTRYRYSVLIMLGGWAIGLMTVYWGRRRGLQSRPR